MGSYDEELTDDQRVWLRERAEARRQLWRALQEAAGIQAAHTAQEFEAERQERIRSLIPVR